MSRTLKDEDLTQTVAIYIGEYSTHIHAVDDWIEKNNKYVRATEPVEIKLTPLSDEIIVKGRVKSLDAEIDKTRAEANLKINDLKEQKSRLLAITHE